MNLKLVYCLVAMLLAAGCGSPPKQNTSSVDQLLGTGAPVQGGSVFISGPVRKNVVPWVEGLTLQRAFVLSGYFGPTSGMRLGVFRKQQMPMYEDLQDLYHGQDMLLEPGDRIEIQPKPK